jgi:hypothetical protein
LATTPQQPNGIAADADIAVGEKDMLPASLVGQWLEDVTSQSRRTTAPSLPDRLSRDIHAQHRPASVGEGRGQSSGPTPDIQGRAAAPVDQSTVAWTQTSGPHCRMEPAHR